MWEHRKVRVRELYSRLRYVGRGKAILVTRLRSASVNPDFPPGFREILTQSGYVLVGVVSLADSRCLIINSGIRTFDLHPVVIRSCLGRDEPEEIVRKTFRLCCVNRERSCGTCIKSCFSPVCDFNLRYPCPSLAGASNGSGRSGDRPSLEITLDPIGAYK